MEKKEWVCRRIFMLAFLCRAKGGEPRPSDENSESMYVPKDKVLDMVKAPAIIER